MMPKQLQPRLHDRATIVGKTGSGKTFLARQILEAFTYVVVLDTKGTINWPNYKRYSDAKKLANAKEDKLIFRPNPRDARNEDLIESFFWWVYERKNTVLYVDEVFSVVSGNSIPDGYHACLTRGRERGITLINSTQRPKRIPQEILSEVEHLYLFRLRLEQDRAKLEEIDDSLDRQMLGRLPNYYFYYSHYDRGVTGPYILTVK